jgi:hypothetical protein
MVEMGLKPSDSFVQKVINLDSCLKSRLGLIIVGQTETAKTTCLQVLHQTLKSSNTQIKSKILYPKSLTTQELFGYEHKQ